MAGKVCLWVKKRWVVVGPTLVGEDKEERETKMTKITLFGQGTFSEEGFRVSGYE